MFSKSIPRLDLQQRWTLLLGLQPASRFPGGLWPLLLCAALLQALAGLLPYLAWFSWPALVYACGQVLRDPRSQASGHPPGALVRGLLALCRRPLAWIPVLLYGMLGLIVFRGLGEAWRLLPPAGLLLPGAAGGLVPYTASEATALLLIGSCSARLAMDHSDPLAIVGLGLRDLVCSPLSWLLLVLAEAIGFSNLALWAATTWHQPWLATLLGHGPFALLALAWACGQAPYRHHQAGLTRSASRQRSADS